MNRSKKAFFLMIAVLIITVAGAGGAFYFADGMLQKKSKQISDLKADQEAVTQQIAIYEDARKKIEELAFIEEVASQVLPESKEQADVIAELRSFAENSDMTIQSMNFSGSVAKDPGTNLDLSQTTQLKDVTGVRVLPVDLVFTTGPEGPTFESLISFLEKIENNRRKMQVTDISLTPNNNNRELLSSIAMSVNIYLRGQ